MITNTTRHLTQTQKSTIKRLLEINMFEGGTKKIQYRIKHLENNSYSVEIYERYAKSSRQFDCRPESQEVKWHFEGKCNFEYKK